MRLKIEKLVYGGAGLARTEQGVLFVPRTAQGDVVEAEIVERKKDYAKARLIELLEPSPDRQQPDCPNYETAGCCHWQHIRYKSQVQYKEAILGETLQRLAHLQWNGEIKRIAGPDRNYRMRATFHVANGQLGFLRENTHTVVPIRSCAALVPELNDFIQTTDAKGACEVHALSAPEVVATFVLEDGSRRRTGSASMEVDGLQYRVSADSFFQPNRFLLASFVKEVIDQVGPGPKHVLELYAGAGFFSIPLAKVVTEVIAIESHRTTARQGRENAALNKTPNIRFFEADVNTAIHDSRLKPHVVVLDPPRAGCGVKVARRIMALKPERIVYVSCNPTTFAREASVLVENYQLREITIVDQFPNTYHIETVALFTIR